MTCLEKGWCEEHQLWHIPKMDEAELRGVFAYSSLPPSLVDGLVEAIRVMELDGAFPISIKAVPIANWTSTQGSTPWEPTMTEALIWTAGSDIAPSPEKPKKRKRAKQEETLTSRIVDEWMRRI